MYKSIGFIFAFNILILLLYINKGLFQQLPSKDNPTECSSYVVLTKTSTVTSTVYLTSILPDLKSGKSLIKEPFSTLPEINVKATPTLTITSSRKVNTKPKIYNIAIMVGSLLTGCIINATGFVMYWWYKKKYGFMVELYLCTIVMVIMMVAMCVEEILFEFINSIYTSSS